MLCDASNSRRSGNIALGAPPCFCKEHGDVNEDLDKICELPYSGNRITNANLTIKNAFNPTAFFRRPKP